jgi:Ca2+-binding RTX toxin-like protein
MPISFCSFSCEPLESRSLLSVTLANGILTVVGTGGHDLIEVQNRADKGEVRVELNGNEQEFAKGDVTRILIFGEAGNDRIGFSGRDGGLNIPGYIEGGNGNDRIEGGEGNDVILGGFGNDVIEGKSGRDRIIGDEGNDIIQGGGGNDQLYGAAGNDYIEGNIGNDYIEGGAGGDDLEGNGGTDSILGNRGNDDFDNSDSLGELLDFNSGDTGPNALPFVTTR